MYDLNKKKVNYLFNLFKNNINVLIYHFFIVFNDYN